MARYAKLPEELLKVRHVALSGDGEPPCRLIFWTPPVPSCNCVIRALFQNRAGHQRHRPGLPPVQAGLELLSQRDEIWAKLDGGTEDYVNMVNGSKVSLEKILANILLVAATAGGHSKPVP